MPWEAKLNFRDTLAFVTDGTGETGVEDGDNYPTTRDSITFGLDSGTNVQERDRSSGVDAKFAGIWENNTSFNPAVIRVDLPNTGTYDVRGAFGDTSFSTTELYISFQDNTTEFATITEATGPAENEYYDASGVLRTEANWVANNAAIQRVFTSTILRVRLGRDDGGGGIRGGKIAHLQITEVDTGDIIIAKVGLNTLGAKHGTKATQQG